MSFIEEGKGSCMISLHKRTLSNKTQCVASQEAGGRAISNCWEPINRKLRRNSFFSLKFLTWQNFRKDNFSEINKRRSKVREYSLKVKKKTPLQVEGLLSMGCGVLGMDTRAHEGWASTPSYPATPRNCRCNLRIFDSSCIAGISCTWWSLHGARPGRPCRPHPPHSWGA